MQITGEQIVKAIATRLNEEGIPPKDSEIVRRLNELTSGEVMQIANFGDLTRWHNDRINKEDT